jgi:glycosyltransferase involved in cell wall biosynthesis
VKVLHLSAVDYGGAGTAALRLHRSLRVSGMDSRMLVLDSRSQEQHVYSLAGLSHAFSLRRLASKVYAKLASRADYYFQLQETSIGISASELLKRSGFTPDIIVAHAMSNFLGPSDVLEFHRASAAAPVVWHLLDMASLTGGCHYAWSCDGFEYQCESCPALRWAPARKAAERVWREKRRVLDNMRTAAVAASSHLFAQAHRSSLFKDKQIEKILLGVDPELFGLGQKDDARRSLGLPLDKKIIFFGAQFLKERRKGMSYMLAALENLAQSQSVRAQDVLLVTAGQEFALGPSSMINFSHLHLGFLQEEARLALAYRAADVFVCPSVEDSGPLMINESMMSGTPVVAFEMGVAGDLIVPGVTGEMAKLYDTSALAEGIGRVLNATVEARLSMSKSARAQAMRLCDPTIQASNFSRLFATLLSG